MKLKIEITMDNAAFEQDEASFETGRILRDLASDMAGKSLSTGKEFHLRDINGNSVGKARVTR